MRLSSIVAFASFVATLTLAAPVPSTSHPSAGSNALAEGEAHASSTEHSDSGPHLVRRTGNEHLRTSIQQHQTHLTNLQGQLPGLQAAHNERTREATQATEDHDKAKKDNRLTQAHITNKKNAVDEERRAQARVQENEHMQSYHTNMIAGHKETIKANEKSDQMSDPNANGPKLGQDILRHSAKAEAAYSRADTAHSRADTAHQNAQRARSN